jgi:hypothetical protein
MKAQELGSPQQKEGVVGVAPEEEAEEDSARRAMSMRAAA